MRKMLLNPGQLRADGVQGADAWCYDERDGLHVYVQVPGQSMPVTVRLAAAVLQKALRTARRAEAQP